VEAEDLRVLYARILDRPDASVEDSFVGLGADSLSYVEMSVQLGARINPLPADWHERSIRSLADSTNRGSGGRAHRWGRTLDTNVVLRAVAIVFIVGSHTEAWVLTGGAHLLLALAGFNFARFHLGTGDGEAPWRRVGRAVAAIAIPASLWIAVVGLLTREYDPSTAAYLNWAFGSPTWDDRWRFWFLEALIWALVGIGLVLSLRRARAFEARHPFEVAAAVLLLALAVRWQLVGVTAEGVEKYAVLPVLWAFALGWLVARSTTWWQRMITSLAIVLSVMGFFDDPRREAIVVVGLLVALWVPQVRVPRFAASVLGVLAAASLAIYVTQWQVYPHLEQDHPYLAVLASLVVGIAYHHLTRPLVGLSRRRSWLHAGPALTRPAP
jgi:acyl carrier protein